MFVADIVTDQQTNIAINRAVMADKNCIYKFVLNFQLKFSGKSFEQKE